MSTMTLPAMSRITRSSMLFMFVIAAFLGITQQASAATFDPEYVISNDNMRSAKSMSVAQIQAFLETQDGPLADLVTSDYDKVITLSTTKDNTNATPDKDETPKPASQIIWEACQAWQISPKVMLTMLQKEQSLLTNAASAKTLARAVGAGVPGSLVFPSTNPVATNRYPGFGNQIWHGARLLSSYGEGNPSFPTWKEGMKKTIYKDATYGTVLHPKNLATFKLYVYNPSIPGNTNFYNIYRRYFGSTFANPRYRKVYKFRKYSNGTYLYTTSLATRYRLIYTSSKKYWDYDGAKFSIDSSASAQASTPVYRFKNKISKKYSFTTSKAKYEARRTTAGRRTWDYQGVAYRVSRSKTPGAVTVYKFQNRYTGGWSHVATRSTVDYYKTHASFRKKWDYEGVAYYLPRYSAPATATP